MHKILVIEDDSIINNSLVGNLKNNGFIVEDISDFISVDEKVKEFQPDLILLDLLLPYYNGYYWCTKIRDITNSPIIYISSVTDNVNIVMAINNGGDDYITKPFDFNVLLAKINAILRRTSANTFEQKINKYNELTLNLSNYILSNGNSVIELTKTETKIMEILINNGGNIVTKETIMQKLWQDENFIDNNTLSVNISRLRKKMEQLDIIDGIVCKKGIGYLLK